MSKIPDENPTVYKSINDLSRKLTVAYQHNHVDRPMIRMAGLWLQEAGFQIGDEVLIDVNPR